VISSSSTRQPDILFLSGVARSGTSALVQVLNEHSSVVMGQERFSVLFHDRKIKESHFRLPRFLDHRPYDTHAHAGRLNDSPEMRSRVQDARYVGDKYPSLFKCFDYVFEHFPLARHVYILRNPLSVMESFDRRAQDPNDAWRHSWEVGLASWNESIAKVCGLSEQQREQMLIVRYEQLYASVGGLSTLFWALGLTPPASDRLERFVTRFKQLADSTGPRREELRAAVARQAHWSGYQTLCDLIDQRGPEWVLPGVDRAVTLA
jgi:hypothetical protein